MELNSDFTKRVAVHSDEVEWLASPMPGVDRRMLDRVGDEVARATTIVRYAPNSNFSSHVHTGGEEFVVLDGVFQDEHGDYPVGSYVRNPPESSHTPSSEKGCVIFVKLWQFDLEDRTQVSVHFDQLKSVGDASRSGVTVYPLFEDGHETVQMEAWDPETEAHIDLPKGGEFLVLDGTFFDGQDLLRKHSWLRLPAGSRLSAKAGKEGARVWMKLHQFGQVK